MRKKKIFLALLAGLSLATLISCGGKDNPNKKDEITDNGGSESITEFKVTFNNYDGTELYSYTAKEGSMAEYKGKTPERTDGDYFATYIFDGWDKPLEEVTQNVVYTAKYNIVYNEAYYSNGLLFELSEDQQGWYIRKYLGSDTDVVVPATFDNLPVTKILTGAFSNNKSIKHIHIGSNIRYIGENAFLNMEKMESITVSDKNPIYSIVDDALIGTYNSLNTTLKSLIYVPSTKVGFYEIPDDVSIYRGCLSGSHLNDLKFSTDVFKPLNIKENLIAETHNKQYAHYVFKDLFGGTEEDVKNADVIHVIVSGGDIPAGMFANNTKLESISLYNNPENPIREIGALSFYGCGNLHSMVIPNTVETIRKRAYENCSFETLAIGEDEDLQLQVVEDYAFNCDVEEKTIDNGLEYVGNDANPYVLAYAIDSNNTRVQEEATFNQFTLFLRDELLADAYYSAGVHVYFNNAKIRSIGAKALYYVDHNFNLPSTVNYIGDNPITPTTYSKLNGGGDSTNKLWYLTDSNDKKYYVGGSGDNQINIDSSVKVITANTFAAINDVNVSSNAAFNYSNSNGLLYSKDKRTLLFANTDAEEITFDVNTKEIGDYAFKGSETFTINVYDLEYISDKAFANNEAADVLEFNFKYADGKLIENRFNNLVYLSSLYDDTTLTKIKVGNKLAYLANIANKDASKTLDLLETEENSIISEANKEQISYDYDDDFCYYEKIYLKLGFMSESIGEE